MGYYGLHLYRRNVLKMLISQAVDFASDQAVCVPGHECVGSKTVITLDTHKLISSIRTWISQQVFKTFLTTTRSFINRLLKSQLRNTTELHFASTTLGGWKSITTSWRGITPLHATSCNLWAANASHSQKKVPSIALKSSQSFKDSNDTNNLLPTAVTAQINTRTNEQVVENYAEVVKTLTGTEYEYLLHID